MKIAQAFKEGTDTYLDGFVRARDVDELVLTTKAGRYVVTEDAAGTLRLRFVEVAEDKKP